MQINQDPSSRSETQKKKRTIKEEILNILEVDSYTAIKKNVC